MAKARGVARFVAVMALACFSAVVDGQSCSNESFSIGYNGVTAFEVSNTDNSCRCSGAVTSQGGISRLDTLSVNHLNVVGTASLPCPSSCDAKIAALNATVLSLQASLATVVAQGCSSGGGGGGSGSAFCTVVRPADGYIVGNANRVVHGASVTYACNLGFNLTGYASQICVSGAFSHDLPVCMPLPCAAVAPLNGAVSAAIVQSFNTATYSCNTGYALNGTETQLCYATRFNATQPNCLGLPCTAVAPTDGTVSATNVVHTTAVNYYCNSGYSISGSTVRTCTATVLSGTQPVCNGNPCGHPGTPSGASSLPASGNIVHEASIIHACNSGYSWTAGNLTRTCFAGVLGGAAPTCTPNPCTTTAPVNGAASATNVAHGGSVTYSCNSPYFLTGTPTQTCSAGSLSSSLPLCLPVYRNCWDAKQQNPGAASGTYYIDPDGSQSTAPRITAYCDMTTDGGGWASIFTVSGSFSLGSRACIFSWNNDDHDSTIMWMDLTCKVSNINADTTNGAKYFTVLRNTAAQQSATALTPRPISSANARPCPLPGSQRVVWFDWQSAILHWGTGSIAMGSVGMSSIRNCYGSYGNLFYIISDNVDMILTGCSAYGAVLLRFNFETNTVTGTPATGFVPQSNNWLQTEEDEFGIVLFTVNGKIFYYNAAGRLALGGTLANPNVLTSQTTVSTWGGDSQQNIDMNGFVDNSGFLWLADWGHDNGGYFACGNDNQLGIGQSNIRLTY